MQPFPAQSPRGELTAGVASEPEVALMLQTEQEAKAEVELPPLIDLCHAPRFPHFPPDATSPSDTQVGGRLQLFGENWENLGCSPSIMRVLREGVGLSFCLRSLLSRRPTPPRDPILSKIVLSLLAKRVIEPVTDTSSPGFYSRLFFVPRKSGGHIPIIDLSI